MSGIVILVESRTGTTVREALEESQGLSLKIGYDIRLTHNCIELDIDPASDLENKYKYYNEQMKRQAKSNHTKEVNHVEKKIHTR